MDMEKDILICRSKANNNTTTTTKKNIAVRYM